MRWLGGLIALLGGLLAAAPATVAAAPDAEHFAFFELEFTGKLRTGAIADLDADGRQDVGVLLTGKDDPSELRFATCLQDANGFSGSCTSIRIPAAARAFDIGEIDGVPGAELLILTDEGVSIASFVKGSFREFTPLHELRTLFAGTGPGKTARLHCLWDVDADARLELILPTIEGPRILRYAEAGLTLLQQIDSHATVTYRLGNPGEEDLLGNRRARAAQTQARFTAPETFVEDFNGDGHVDVMTLQGKHLRVFLQQVGGRFPAVPSFEWNRSILDGEEQEDPVASEGLSFTDLNGDGTSDIIAAKWASPRERTRIDRYIYYARGGLRYPEEPDQKVRTESIDRRLMVADLNRDRRADLVIPFFHFAVAQAAKILTQNAIKIQFRLFLMKEDGRYSQDGDKPFARVDRRIGLNYDIDVMGFVFGSKSLPEDGFRPLISFNADANGDGYADLVADTGSDRLRFYWGNEQARYASSPDLVIKHESALNYDLVDLNGDGKTDVVTYHGPRDRTPERRIERRLPKGSAQPTKRELKPAVGARGPVVKILLSR